MMKNEWRDKLNEGMFGRCYLQDKLVVWMNGYCFKVKNLATGTVYANEFMNAGTAKRFAERKFKTLKCFGK